MKVTTFGLIVGGAGLAGVPGLSGFFSKEEIFLALSHNGQMIYLGGALFAAFLTAYYTFRMIFLVLRPQHVHLHSHGEEHATDSPIVMLLPIVFLSLLTIFFYFAGGSIAHAVGEAFHVHVSALMLVAIGVVAVGIAIAWFDFGRRNAARRGFVAGLGPLYTLFTNKWYIDNFYHAVIVRATWAIAAVMARFETRGFDDSFDKLAEDIASSGGVLAKVQSGWVQGYAAMLVVMISAFAFYIGFR